MGKRHGKATDAMKRKGLHKAGVVKHATEEEFEATLELVAHYYNRSYSQQQIVVRLKEERGVEVSQMQVSNYVKKLKERWREASTEKRQDHIDEVVAQLKLIKTEAWEAYELSKKGERTVTKEYAVPLSLKKAVEDLPEGERGQAEESRKLKLMKKQIRELTRLPASHFLRTILDCVAIEIDLRGLSAPKTVSVNDAQGKKVLDWTTHADALPAMRNLNNELARLREEMGVVDAEVIERDE